MEEDKGIYDRSRSIMGSAEGFFINFEQTMAQESAEIEAQNEIYRQKHIDWINRISNLGSTPS